MPTVYVVCQPRPMKNRPQSMYDISPALEHGELKFIFTSDMINPSSDPDAAVEHVQGVLEDIQPHDYIVWAGGDPLALAIVAAVAAERLEGEFRYLKWERLRDPVTNRREGKGYYAPLHIKGV